MSKFFKQLSFDSKDLKDRNFLLKLIGILLFLGVVLFYGGYLAGQAAYSFLN